MSACPPEVLALVERFQRNRAAYRSPAYNEAQARREFIDPLSQAVGWDVHNTFSLAAVKTPAAQTALQRQIDATDRQIDQLVYELYGLTEEEIRIVEEATQS